MINTYINLLNNSKAPRRAKKQLSSLLKCSRINDDGEYVIIIPVRAGINENGVYKEVMENSNDIFGTVSRYIKQADEWTTFAEELFINNYGSLLSDLVDEISYEFDAVDISNDLVRIINGRKQNILDITFSIKFR